MTMTGKTRYKVGPFVFDNNVSNFAYQKAETLKQVDMYYIGVNHKHFFSKYPD